MNSDEVWDLLELISSIDRRKVGLTDRQTWEGLAGDLPAADAQAAVIAHYRESREWIMPADVRSRVKAMRRARLERGIIPAPSAGLADDPASYRPELRATIRQIADGKRVPLAIVPPVREGEPPEAWAEARAVNGGALASRPKLTRQQIALRQAEESRTERAAREAGSSPGQAGGAA